MSDPNKEDRLQAISDDLPYTHPEKWAAIQKQWGEGASLGACLDAHNALVNEIYEERAI